MEENVEVILSMKQMKEFSPAVTRLLGFLNNNGVITQV